MTMTQPESEEMWRAYLSDPTGVIERECEDHHFKQADVALTYASAMLNEDLAPVDWHRANAAIRNRWPKGLDRVKKMAWKILNVEQAKRAGQPESVDGER